MCGMFRALIAILMASSLAACTPYQPYRPTLGAAPADCTPAPGQPIASECRQRTHEHTKHYDLFFVEFDDQGWLHPKEESGSGDANGQLDTVMDALQGLAKDHEGISLVVFVHGWKHNASWDDENVANFRTSLLAASQVEASNEQELGIKARRVIGVYVAWRGKSLALPEPLISLSFWDRKFTAQHVAQGSARELFSRLRGFQRDQNSRDPTCHTGTSRCKVRMLMIGHSFGALILYTAISEALVDSLAADEDSGADEGPIQPFGDMVILINPAFEASRYENLYRIATGRPYRRYQSPILVSVTSSADWATGLAFPLGRFFNTMFEHAASKPEDTANNNTIGHIPRYLTHRLSLTKEESPECTGWIDLDTVVDVKDRLKQMKVNLDIERRNNQAFFDRNLDGKLLRDHWSRNFCGKLLLEQIPCQSERQCPPNSPIWNIQTDAELIPGHNEINKPAFVNFLRQLYHGSVSNPF